MVAKPVLVALASLRTPVVGLAALRAAQPAPGAGAGPGDPAPVALRATPGCAARRRRTAAGRRCRPLHRPCRRARRALRALPAAAGPGAERLPRVQCAHRPLPRRARLHALRHGGQS